MSKEEKESKYGNLIEIKSCMNMDIEIQGLGYKVIINNISSDIMMLLFDKRNKVRLVTTYYFLYAKYSNIELEFFLSPSTNEYTTYNFFVSSISKNKVTLTYTESEDIQDFIVGEELLEAEIERKLKDKDIEKLDEALSKSRIKKWDKGKAGQE